MNTRSLGGIGLAVTLAFFCVTRADVQAQAQARKAVVEIVDASGNPIDGVHLKTSISDGATLLQPKGRPVSDPKGGTEYDISTPNPASITVEANAQGHVPAIGTYSLQAAGASKVKLIMESGVKIGGVVLDPSKKPLPGARVVIQGPIKDEQGQFLLTTYDSVLTDKDGRWSTQTAPKTFSGLDFSVTHADFMPTEFEQAPDNGGAGPFILSRESLVAEKAEMPIQAALRLAGTVLNPDGKPFAGATLRLFLQGQGNPSPIVRSDAKGEFHFVVYEPTETSLMVEAAGFAVQVMQVSVSAENKPLEIKLDHGGKISGRVVDQLQKPIAGATVSAQQSQGGIPAPSWNGITDAKGEFVWDGAPRVPVIFTIMKPGYSSARIASQAQPSTQPPQPLSVVLMQTFLVSGKITDAATKQPIPVFGVIQGRTYDGGDTINWDFRPPVLNREGNLSITLENQNGGELVYMIQAGGYSPVQTPAYAEQGIHEFNAALKKSVGFSGKVVFPDGSPAGGVQVVEVGLQIPSLSGFQLSVRDTDAMIGTKPDGSFFLKELVAEPSFVAANQKGYGEIQFKDFEKTHKIVLEPWGKIEGEFRVGSKPAPNRTLMVSTRTKPQVGYSRALPVVTDAAGKFSIAMVPPGERVVSEIIQIANGSRSGLTEIVKVLPGVTTTVKLGGTGRPIIGKVKLSDPTVKTDWKSGYFNFQTAFRPPPFRTQEDVRAWQRSPEFKEAQAKMKTFTVVFAEDGSFRIDDVPAGDFTLSLNLLETLDPQRGQRMLGYLGKAVSMPEIPGGRSDEPLDLGTLDMQIQGNR